MQLSISREGRIGNVTLGAIDRDGQAEGTGEAVAAGGALQEELDAFLAFASGGVLLWHDPDGAFEGALGGLSLPDDVTLVREGTSSRFELLCRVNDLAADETLLLYRARRHRVERSDWLADVEAYADCFYESALLSRRRSVSRGHLAGRRIFADSHAQARGRDLVESIVRAEVRGLARPRGPARNPAERLRHSRPAGADRSARPADGPVLQSGAWPGPS